MFSFFWEKNSKTAILMTLECPCNLHKQQLMSTTGMIMFHNKICNEFKIKAKEDDLIEKNTWCAG